MGLVNRSLGALLGLALVVAGAVALLEIGAVVVGADPLVARHDRWLAWASGASWDGRSTWLTCVALVAAGLAFLGLQLVRQRPAELAAAVEGPLPARVSRSDLEHEVAADLGQVQGVATARVRLRRRGFEVRATVVAGDLPSLRDQLTATARGSLAARGADAGGPVKVDVRRQPARSS